LGKQIQGFNPVDECLNLEKQLRLRLSLGGVVIAIVARGQQEGVQYIREVVVG